MLRSQRCGQRTISPARDHGPLGGYRVLDGIRRLPALTVCRAWIADWLRRPRIGPGQPALRVGAHRVDGFHEGYGEDREAEGCGPRAGRSEGSDVHGLELRREEAVIQGDVIGSHVVPKLTGGWPWGQSRASKQAAPQGREPCSPGDSGSFARSRIQKESRFRRAAAFSTVRTSIGFHP